MAYGIGLYNTNGKVFASPDTPCMHFSHKVPFSVSGATTNHLVSLGLSVNSRVVAYCRTDRGVSVYGGITNINGVWHQSITAQAAVNGTLYVFTNDVPPSDSRYGLEMYGADGRRTYSTACRPLANLTGSLSRNGTIIYTRSPAVIPVPCEYWVQKIQQGQNVQLWIGAPVAYGDHVQFIARGSAIMPSETGFGFEVFGGTVNYIDTTHYD